MYQSSSPYAQPMSVPTYGGSGYTPPVNGSVQPGDISYGQIVGGDGKIVYQLFKAVPASYPTPGGTLVGVQWVPTEAVSSIPPGALPANPDFVTNWVRSNPTAAQQALSSTKDRDKESKHSRHTSDYDSLQKARERDAAESNRRQSWNPSQATNGIPFPGSTASVTGYPQSNNTGHTGYPQSTATGYPQASTAVYGSPYAVFGDPSQSYMNPYGVASGGHPVSTTDTHTLAHQMSSMDLNAARSKDSKERERKNSEHASGKRSRRQSAYEPPKVNDPYALPPASKDYQLPSGLFGATVPGYVPPYASSQSSDPSPNSQSRDLSYGTQGPYQYPQQQQASGAGIYGVPYASSSSSTRARANSSVGRATTPAAPTHVNAAGVEVYPPGHIMEGLPKNPTSKSRAASPNPYPIHPVQQPPQSSLAGYPGGPPPRAASSQGSGGRPASRVGQLNGTLPAHQLAAPESFSRPIVAGLPYSAFKPTKIHDMDAFFSQMAKMPPVLETHDVRAEDWHRFMEDLTLAWTGRLPAQVRADGKVTPPSYLASELIHTWNTCFFEPRGVEIVLYRGLQRRSGKLYGRSDLDPSALGPGSGFLSESSSSSSEDTDSDDPYPPPNNRNQTASADLAAARRRYYEQKQADIQRRKERRRRNREKRRNKRYTLFANCIRDGGPNRSMMPPGGHTMGTTGGTAPQGAAMMPSVSSYPGMYGLPGSMPGGMPPPGVAGSMGPPPGKARSHSRNTNSSGGY